MRSKISYLWVLSQCLNDPLFCGCNFVCFVPQEALTSPPLKLWKATQRKSFTMCRSSEAPSTVRCSPGLVGVVPAATATLVPCGAKRCSWEFLMDGFGGWLYPNFLVLYGVRRGNTCRGFLLREKVQVFLHFQQYSKSEEWLTFRKKNEITKKSCLMLQK